MTTLTQVTTILPNNISSYHFELVVNMSCLSLQSPASLTYHLWHVLSTTAVSCLTSLTYHLWHVLFTTAVPCLTSLTYHLWHVLSTITVPCLTDLSSVTCPVYHYSPLPQLHGIYLCSYLVRYDSYLLTLHYQSIIGKSNRKNMKNRKIGSVEK